jgi:hypothetical protein
MNIRLFRWLLLAATLNISTRGEESRPNLSLKATQETLPTIKLPYGVWQASSYDNSSDVSPSHRFAELV